jgi:hypothetical protein
MMDSFLTRHLRDAGETYFGHLGFTLKAGAILLLAAAVVVVHGILPCVCTHTGSNLLARLQAEMAARKAKCEANCRKHSVH